jgi:hypothetical protein
MMMSSLLARRCHAATRLMGNGQTLFYHVSDENDHTISSMTDEAIA